MKYYSKNGKRLNGWQDALNRLQNEMGKVCSRTTCCSFWEIRIFIPRFLMVSQAGLIWRENLYGKKIIIEAVMDDVESQFIIKLDYFTDFTSSVSGKLGCDKECPYIQVSNFFLSVSQAQLFMVGLLPHLHSRTLNVITVSDGSAESVIRSFGVISDPYMAFSRCLLANM